MSDKYAGKLHADKLRSADDLRAEGRDARKAMRGAESCKWGMSTFCVAEPDDACNAAIRELGRDAGEERCWCAQQWLEGYAEEERRLYEQARGRGTE